MKLRTDFSEPITLDTNVLPWTPSPHPGVERRLLDRDGDEVARATSIVRYAPNARFEHHIHGAGEEIFVLEGVFRDESGAWPVGSYLRNPWGTEHTPFTLDEGCVILVKLRQMAEDDGRQVGIDTADGHFHAGEREGLEVMDLHRYRTEHVRLERWAPGARGPATAAAGGEEILVVDGALLSGEEECRAGHWLRFPGGHPLALSTTSGCRLWVKRGHLPR